MKTTNQNCPVCNCQIQDGHEIFCPTCNWELIVIPNTASQGLKNFYKEKLELHKASFRETDKLNEEILNKEKQLEKIEKQKSELEAQNKSLASDMANQKPLMDKVKKLEQESNESEKTIKDLKEKLKKEKEAKEKEQRAHEATKTKNRFKL
ncbi:MAG: hypothetical protein JWQ09_3136 [Segetibacter sp.]|nr:hypothetical protein [Segetibacter sp.]